MNEIILFQSSIWLLLIALNTYFILKYVSVKKQLLSTQLTVQVNKEKKVEKTKINPTLNSIKIKELSAVIDEIKKEEDLKKHFKIQKLMMVLNNPIQEFSQTQNFEIQSKKRESKRQKPDFRTKLLSHHFDLTDAELNLSELIIQEKSCGEIAEILDLKTGTVRVYKNKLKSKLNLSTENNLGQYLIALDGQKFLV